jgi:hypothetical protein
MSDLSRKMHFFHQKSYMTLSLNDRMGERSICLFLALKELSARTIDNKLIVVLGADAIASSTVTMYPRQRQFTSILVDLPEEIVTIVTDQAILDLLEHYPFCSIRELARLTCIPTTTVH